MKRILLFLCVLWFQSYAQISWTVDGKLSNGLVLTTLSHELPNGWHTYWKNPGDSGLPATIQSLTKQVVFDDLVFPKPYVIMTDPILSIGYEGTVNYKLPIQVPQLPMTIFAKYDWLECNEVCLQKSKELSLLIPKHLDIIDQVSAQDYSFEIVQSKEIIKFKFADDVASAEFFPYANDYVDLATVKFKGNELHVRSLRDNLDLLEGELFVNDSEKPLVVRQKPVQVKGGDSLLLFVIFAFIGGLLLNIMPCVLPVLGIKAMQLKKQSSGHQARDATAYGLGVLVSLFALFFILSLFKLSGMIVGWGFQLQSPIMITCLIALFLIFILVDLDLMTIQLPQAFFNKPRTSMFFYGVLTTIVATPCTAPFLGTALSVALFQPFGIGLLIFFFISLGLSLPMMLIILKPNVIRFFPSSGRWNYVLKYSFSLGFVVTIFWLFWVLSSQVSVLVYYVGLVGLIAISAFLIRKSAKYTLTKSKVILLGVTCLVPVFIGLYQPSPSRVWLDFKQVNFSKLDLEKRKYFIDVTAKWCVTCQSNKILVLNVNKTKKLFKSNNVLLIRADWTNNDPKVTALLKKFDQVSIPTYIYFDGGKYHVLTDILTFDDLKRIIE